MEVVFDWVKGVVFYIILLTVVNHLIPNKKYEKYIRLFTGMLLVIIVMKPITQIFSWNELFDRNFLKNLEDQLELNWGEEAIASDWNEIQEEQMFDEYKRQVSAYVEAQANALGITVENVQVEVTKQEDWIQPVRISMEASVAGKERELDKITIKDIIIEEKEGNNQKESTKELKQLQTMLAQYYGIEESQVQINGR